MSLSPESSPWEEPEEPKAWPSGLRFRVQVLWLRVQGSGFRVSKAKDGHII